MFKKRKRLGEYPACDHLNIALMKLLKNADENRVAIEEILYASCGNPILADRQT